MIITTSWDDGHPLDVRVLELLEKYGLKGTFYVPLSNPENPVMSKELIREISQSQEIGAHTVNHLYLNKLNYAEAHYEISHSKTLLEDIVGVPVQAFCFPGGKFSGRDMLLVKEAGYLFARTAKLLSVASPDHSSSLMHTTVQIFNHTTLTLINHCVKSKNACPIYHSSFFIPFHKNFLKLSEHYIARCRELDGIFHIWGHSWEIDKFNLWGQFEELLRLLGSLKEVQHLNNSEAWKMIRSRESLSDMTLGGGEREYVGKILSGSGELET